MSPFLNFRATTTLLIVALIGLLLPALHAAESKRFTDSLSLEQKKATGLDQLTSDNVAVINALVRQDETAAEYRNNTIRSTRFSERRTDHEREIAGLTRLDKEQVAGLDALVGQRFEPAPTLVATGTSLLGSNGVSGVENVSNRQKPEIHGEFSLTYGWGKGGSVMGGDATLFYQDPDRRYAVLFNYSQYRGKGYLPGFYPCDGIYPGRFGNDGIFADHP